MDMKLVLPPEYIAQATELVKKAKTRVSLIAMVIADHPGTHELIEALQDAAKRGVVVKVCADIFTYGEVSGSFLPVRYYSPGVRQVNTMVKNLKASGVKFSWLGRAHMTLFNGRTHTKWCVIDDDCFVFGGVNIHQVNITGYRDFMFRLKNAQLADRLTHEQKRIAKAERSSTNYPSSTYELEGNSVLIDGGIFGHSVIYSRAIELAKEASHIVFVSQYCPTGKLARLFKKSNVELYFNQPEKAGDFLNRTIIRLNMAISGLESHYKKDQYLHAKFMIFTMKDGSRVAITGSHNFAYTGVLFGTREIALETTDEKIISQLDSFYKKYVKS